MFSKYIKSLTWQNFSKVQTLVCEKKFNMNVLNKVEQTTEKRLS